MKKAIEQMLRRVGLERLIFRYVYLKDHRKHRAADAVFEREHTDYRFPPPFLRFDVIASSSASNFYQTGRETAVLISRDLQQYVAPGKAVDVLEWGCGPGRLLQHLPAANPEVELRLNGTDMYPPSIKWASANLSDLASFTLNRIKPPLPLGDGSMDFVYAVSVFTHLSLELSEQWMKEILRVLRPGGVFWFTAHSGKHHRQKLDAKQLARLDRNEYVDIHSHHDGSQMFEGIHPEACMRSLVEKAGADIQEYRPSGLQEYQDVWIIRKKS